MHSPHQMVTEVLDGLNAGEIFYSNIKNAVNSDINERSKYTGTG